MKKILFIPFLFALGNCAPNEQQFGSIPGDSPYQHVLESRIDQEREDKIGRKSGPKTLRFVTSAAEDSETRDFNAEAVAEKSRNNKADTSCHCAVEENSDAPIEISKPSKKVRKVHQYGSGRRW